MEEQALTGTNVTTTPSTTPKSGLDEKLVKKLAKLARLALDDNEVRALVPELSGIVRHVESLQAVDTRGVPPMTHGAPLAAANDEAVAAAAAAGDILGRRAVEQSAGYDAADGTVKVPKVID